MSILDPLASAFSPWWKDGQTTSGVPVQLAYSLGIKALLAVKPPSNTNSKGTIGTSMVELV